MRLEIPHGSHWRETSNRLRERDPAGRPLVLKLAVIPERQALHGFHNQLANGRPRISEIFSGPRLINSSVMVPLNPA